MIARLGDQLWGSHGVAAAQCCYVLAELPLETAADAHGARLQLIGHDHRAGGRGPALAAWRVRSKHWPGPL